MSQESDTSERNLENSTQEDHPTSATVSTDTRAQVNSSIDQRTNFLTTPVKSKGEVAERASRIAQCLERLWVMLMAIMPGLPPVVFILLSHRESKRKMGHFHALRWRGDGSRNAHEIAIDPGLFDDSTAEELLETIIHEAAHAHLYATTGSSGCRRDYHQKKSFRAEAERLGLVCGFFNCRHGWARTSWPESGIPERYLPLLEYLKCELPWGTQQPELPKAVGPIAPSRRPPGPGHVRLSCACRSIYTTPSVAREGQIRCGRCGEEFTQRTLI